MNALLFGTYNSRHAANALLVGDLRAAGVTVRECHEPLWEEARDKDAPYFAPAGLAALALRYARAASRLARRIGGEGGAASLLVVGFNGQLDVLLARLLDRRRPILFAPLVTVTETLVADRETYVEGSVAAALLAALDRATLRAADVVLIDTAAHRDYLIERLGVAPDKVFVQYLGAEAPFAAEGARRWATAADEPPAPPGALVRVLGYSQYLPLHGNETIALAARLVPSDAGITFDLVGTGAERARSDAFVKKLSHVRTTDWVPYDELPGRIAAADVVLGVFGRSVKARMVIPNKIWQAAAVGSAIVTADTPAIREAFVPGESICTVEPTPRALADALLALARDPERRARLARGARAAFL
ncbi:MAG: glycosyltransferase family 4 protein, partial [Deltaproteobacteria bacterium]|nr:glycosyltransferase family 4 protein [Deltaproteobacteria bacterium]